MTASKVSDLADVLGDREKRKAKTSKGLLGQSIEEIITKMKSAWIQIIETVKTREFDKDVILQNNNFLYIIISLILVFVLYMVLDYIFRGDKKCDLIKDGEVNNLAENILSIQKKLYKVVPL